MGNKQINKTKQNFGSITIILDKSYYSAGEQINGVVYLDLKTNHPSNVLLLHIKGKEKFKYYKQHSKRNTETNEIKKTILEYKDSKKFFDHMFPLYICNGSYFPSGQFQFPFSFVLKNDLPGSFKNKKMMYGKKAYSIIYYKIKIGLFNHSTKEIFKKQVDLNITSFQDRAGITQTEMFNKNVRAYCFCQKLGTLNFNCYFEKDRFYFGETTNLIFDIDTVELKTDIDKIIVSLKRIITLSSSKFSNREEETIMSNEINNKILRGKKYLFSEGNGIIINLNLNSENQNSGSTKGQIIQCEYEIHAQLKLDTFTCSPLMIKLPIKIFNPPMKSNFVQPNNWSPQIMNPYVATFSSEYQFNKKSFFENNQNYFHNNVNMNNGIYTNDVNINVGVNNNMNTNIGINNNMNVNMGINNNDMNINMGVNNNDMNLNMESNNNMNIKMEVNNNDMNIDMGVNNDGMNQ